MAAILRSRCKRTLITYTTRRLASVQAGRRADLIGQPILPTFGPAAYECAPRRGQALRWEPFGDEFTDDLSAPDPGAFNPRTQWRCLISCRWECEPKKLQNRVAATDPTAPKNRSAGDISGLASAYSNL